MVWHPESADGPVNATLHYYDVEVFVGVHGEVCATCSCPATVICKHIVEALIYIAWHEPLPSTPPASWMWSFLNYYSDLCRIIEESGAGDIEL
jgi:hypothetical protein